jgi:hypothetical protein
MISTLSVIEWKDDFNDFFCGADLDNTIYFWSNIIGFKLLLNAMFMY